MKGVKNLKIMAAGLCLSTTLLIGCGNKNTSLLDSSTINYEAEIPTGKISYNDLNNYIKLVVFEHENTSYNRIIIKDKNTYVGGFRKGIAEYYDNISYIDLKTGVPIINYKSYNDNTEIIWIVGENLNIVREYDITSYLLQHDFIKKEYSVEEILTFFEEKIRPTLGSSEKELVK